LKKLILIRHAKSDMGPPDLERCLNEQGLADAPVMGTRLARNGIRPGQLVASSALRAQETARLMAAELDYPVEDIVVEPRLYNAQVDAWLEIIRELNDRWSSVMCVGHNPGVSDLAAGVYGMPVMDVPTCSVMTLDFAATYWSEVPSSFPAATDYDYPRK